MVPEIIVTARRGGGHDGSAVTLRERVNISDFESNHFAAQLVERLGWAVNDAHEAEQKADERPEQGAYEQDEHRSDQLAVTLA
jgi:hypothetical protein